MWDAITTIIFFGVVGGLLAMLIWLDHREEMERIKSANKQD